MTGQPGMEAGISRRTAYILATFPRDVAFRSEVRAQLPPGEVRQVGNVSTHIRRVLKKGGRPTKNQATHKFQDALKMFSDCGWIDRREESVVIKDRQALLKFSQGESLGHRS